MAAGRKPRHQFTHDPTGELYGLPTYRRNEAPDGLATRRQLSALGLRKGGQDPVAQVMGRWGKVSYLYRVDLAVPQFTLTWEKWHATFVAARSRQRCDTCGRAGLGYIPQQGAPAYGRCWDCMGMPPTEDLPATCHLCRGTCGVLCVSCVAGRTDPDHCPICPGDGIAVCPACA